MLRRFSWATSGRLARRFVTSARPGEVYVIATPIGNERDITLRALDILASVDIIAAEDTRRLGLLLQRVGIDRRSGQQLISAHKFNEKKGAEWLIEQTKQGYSACFVSDAGTPTISDPGALIANLSAIQGVKVVPVPGPSAVLAALSISGMTGDAFSFCGFLPRKGRARTEEIHRIVDETRTTVFFESPRRIIATMQQLQDAMGEFAQHRPCVCCRELTKRHEDILRGSVTSVLEKLHKFSAEQERVKGELTLVVGGMSPSLEGAAEAQDARQLELYRVLREHRVSVADSVKIVTAHTNGRKSEVYAMARAIEKTEAAEGSTE
jgi:16S rRNA (cytidine1402-2'-O)-methyltransferase